MIYVLYHGGGCPDGFGAAWAAWRKLGDDARYVPVLYHEPVPTMEPGSTVYLVDFCYPRDVLFGIATRMHKTIVIDHHKTALAAVRPGHPDDAGVFTLLESGERVPVLDGSVPSDKVEFLYGNPVHDGWLQALFDMDHSGAVLTWQHFHPGEPVPLMLQYVEDRDLWRWAMPYSREFSAYLASIPQDFAAWDALSSELERWLEGRVPTSMHMTRVAEQGAAILRAQAQTIEQAVRRHRWAVLGGHRVPIVNATVHGSETGEALCLQHPDAPFAAYYFDTADGRRGWGLRSRNGFDVSEVAKLYGGGGHAAAAGFTTGLDYYGDAR